MQLPRETYVYKTKIGAPRTLPGQNQENPTRPHNQIRRRNRSGPARLFAVTWDGEGGERKGRKGKGDEGEWREGKWKGEGGGVSA